MNPKPPEPFRGMENFLCGTIFGTENFLEIDAEENAEWKMNFIPFADLWYISQELKRTGAEDGMYWKFVSTMAHSILPAFSAHTIDDAYGLEC